MTKMFESFIEELSSATRVIVEKQVKKVKEKKFGNCKKLRTFNNHNSTIVLSECVINYGPGYRVYFIVNDGEVKFLTGGTKKTQHKDINFTRSLLESGMLCSVNALKAQA